MKVRTHYVRKLVEQSGSGAAAARIMGVSAATVNAATHKNVVQERYEVSAKHILEKNAGKKQNCNIVPHILPNTLDVERDIEIMRTPKYTIRIKDETVREQFLTIWQKYFADHGTLEE